LGLLDNHAGLVNFVYLHEVLVVLEYHFFNGSFLWLLMLRGIVLDTPLTNEYGGAFMKTLIHNVWCLQRLSLVGIGCTTLCLQVVLKVLLE
jgi:hypothetical protein